MKSDINFIERVHNSCTKPCVGLTPSVDGTWGDCKIDGTLAAKTCDLGCKGTFQISGDQPTCTYGVLSKGTITCGCAGGQFVANQFDSNGHQAGRHCRTCTSCPPGSIVTTQCGYDGTGAFIGITDTQCEACPANTFSNKKANRCITCTDCATDGGRVGPETGRRLQITETTPCGLDTDTVCGAPVEEAHTDPCHPDDDADVAGAQRCAGPSAKEILHFFTIPSTNSFYTQNAFKCHRMPHEHPTVEFRCNVVQVPGSACLCS
jgi:hypothetical protein